MIESDADGLEDRGVEIVEHGHEDIFEEKGELNGYKEVEGNDGPVIDKFEK